MKDIEQLRQEYEKQDKLSRNNAPTKSSGAGAVFRAWDKYKSATQREKAWDRGVG